jgi:outer membrane lipoprotein-sorting protein
MKLLIVPVLAVVLAQAGDDPAVLMQKMENKIARAKSVRVTFAAKAESPKGDLTMNGSLALAGDRARAELELGMAGKSMKILSVSDGTKTVSVQDGKTTEKPDKKDARPLVNAALARSGVTALFLLSQPSSKDGKKDGKGDIKLSEFKKLNSEKVGGRDAVVIEFTLTFQEQKPMRGTVWLDAQTGLPLKRVLRGEEKGNAFTITETYSDLTLDAQLDAKLFEFPK